MFYLFTPKFKSGVWPMIAGVFDQNDEGIDESGSEPLYISLVKEYNEIPTCLASVMGHLIVSSDFVEQMRRLIGDYVFFDPIEVRGNAVLLEFFYIKPKCIVTFDYEKIEGEIFGDYHFVISGFPDEPIFYEATSGWYVSQEFKDLFEENDFCGWQFKEARVG